MTTTVTNRRMSHMGRAAFLCPEVTMPRWLIILVAVLVVLGIVVLFAEHVAVHVH